MALVVAAIVVVAAVVVSIVVGSAIALPPLRLSADEISMGSNCSFTVQLVSFLLTSQSCVPWAKQTFGSTLLLI